MSARVCVPCSEGFSDTSDKDRTIAKQAAELEQLRPSLYPSTEMVQLVAERDAAERRCAEQETELARLRQERNEARDELRRVMAERDDAAEKARYWQARGENLRIGRDRLETTITALREDLAQSAAVAPHPLDDTAMSVSAVYGCPPEDDQ